MASFDGDLRALVAALGKKGATFWGSTKGRKILRLLACVACLTKRKRVLSYLITKRGVPINSVPEDELALDYKDPERQQYNQRLTPLLITIFRGQESFALYMVALQPGANFELDRVVGLNGSTCTALHYMAHMGYVP